MTVLCWCCGRSTEGANLHTTVPAALKERLDEYCKNQDLTVSEVVQQAVMMMIAPAKDAETAE